MNKDKQILILTQRIELLEKQNEDLRAENQEMKLQVEESKRFANMPNNVLNRTIKNVRQEEAKFKALIAETQEIKKELENNLEALKKTHTLYQSIFSDLCLQFPYQGRNTRYQQCQDRRPLPLSQRQRTLEPSPCS